MFSTTGGRACLGCVRIMVDRSAGRSIYGHACSVVHACAEVSTQPILVMLMGKHVWKGVVKCRERHRDWQLVTGRCRHLCKMRYREPRGANWVTIDRLGGCVQAPMNMTTLGCFSRCISDTSALKSCSGACMIQTPANPGQPCLGCAAAKVIVLPESAECPCCKVCHHVNTPAPMQSIPQCNATALLCIRNRPVAIPHQRKPTAQSIKKVASKGLACKATSK